MSQHYKSAKQKRTQKARMCVFLNPSVDRYVVITTTVSVQRWSLVSDVSVLHEEWIIQILPHHKTCT